MLATIHTISDGIIIRKSLKWKNISMDDNEPFNCKAIYQKLVSFMNNKLDSFCCNKPKLSTFEKYLRNIQSVKNKLDHTPWSIPINLDEEGNTIFLKDLDFYLMISGLLLKCCSLFKGFIPKHHCPPINRLLPSFVSNIKKVHVVVGKLPNSNWLETINYYHQNNDYINSLDELETHLNKPNYNSDTTHIFKLLFEAFSELPENRLDESHKTKALKELNKSFSSIKTFPKHITMSEWKTVRCAITTLILYGDNLEPVNNIYESIQKTLINNSSLNIKEEKQFFEKQIHEANKLISKKVEINTLALETFTEIVESLNMDTNSSNQPESFIEWIHNPKVFVKTIQSAITNGYITLKGNSDMKPIIEFICNFVKVKKQNNSGHLTLDSLRSYFKKANTGEL